MTSLNKYKDKSDATGQSPSKRNRRSFHQHILLHSDKEVHRPRTGYQNHLTTPIYSLLSNQDFWGKSQCYSMIALFKIRYSKSLCFFWLNSQSGFSLSACPPSLCTSSGYAPGSGNGWPTCPAPALPQVDQRSCQPSALLPETWLEKLLQCNTCKKSFWKSLRRLAKVKTSSVCACWHNSTKWRW